MSDLLILGIGVSKTKNDGVMRFERYCKSHGLEYIIVGDGKEWNGGNMAEGAGGGQKINELREAIQNIENYETSDKLIIVCDTFDLFPVADKDEIIEKYNRICPENHILFSSEVFCWPQKGLASRYPPPYPNPNSRYKYLNSGSFMGKVKDIYKLIINTTIKNTEDDQLYFTIKMLNKEPIILDYECQLFQAVNGAKRDLIIHKNRIFNKDTKAYPIFIHGNGPAKTFLNKVENYISDNSNILYRYIAPTFKVFIAAYIDSNNTDTISFIKNISTLNNINNCCVYLYDKNNKEQTRVAGKIFGFNYVPDCNTYVFDNSFIESGCDYYFLLEQRCKITEKNILNEITSYMQDYRIVSPLMISQKNRLFSNFWGELNDNGYYLRSDDYLELIRRELIGLWNVPYVSGAIMIHKSIIQDYNLTAESPYESDIDMNLCFNLRKNTLFMYMCNIKEYGYL